MQQHSWLLHFDLLLIQLPDMAWETSEDCPKPLALYFTGDQEKAPGSKFQTSSVPAIADIWEVNQKMEELSLSLSSVKNAFPIKIK